jgi:hypothetical protein
MRTRTGIVLNCVVALAAGLSLGERSHADDGESPNLYAHVEVELHAPDCIYRGVPAIGSLRITNPYVYEEQADPAVSDREKMLRQYPAWYEIPAFDLLTQHPLPISVTICDQEGAIVNEPGSVSFYAFMTADPDMLNPPQSPLPYMRDRVVITRDRPWSTTVNLTEWISDLEPGTYTLQAHVHISRYSTPEYAQTSNVVRFTVRELDNATAQLLVAAMHAEVLPDLSNVETYIAASEQVDTVYRMLPDTLQAQLQLLHHVSIATADSARLRNMVESLSAVSREVLSDGDCIRLYEAYLILDMQADAEAFKAAMTESRPHVVHQLDAIDADGGLLRTFMELDRTTDDAGGDTTQRGTTGCGSPD